MLSLKKDSIKLCNKRNYSLQIIFDIYKPVSLFKHGRQRHFSLYPLAKYHSFRLRICSLSNIYMLHYCIAICQIKYVILCQFNGYLVFICFCAENISALYNFLFVSQSFSCFSVLFRNLFKFHISRHTCTAYLFLRFHNTGI